METILIRKALQRFQGNVSQAAEALGLNRALYRQWKSMGFSPRETDPFKRRKPRRTPFERRIIRSALWLAIPGTG